MHKLPKPTDASGNAYVAKDVFDLCISRVRAPDLRKRLGALSDRIGAAAEQYDNAASSAALHTIARKTHVGDVSRAELVDVYTKRMVAKSQPGRPVYYRILAAPANGRCPLCGVGSVNTLDHHLPKKEYPQLSVTPNNLIPSCQWCQTAKREAFPTAAGEQTLHPYFDDFSYGVWLHAEVTEGTPASFHFFVRTPPEWPALIAERLESHLSCFDLQTLFASNAGSELSGIRARLIRLHSAGGQMAVRDHLQEEADSWATEWPNAWRTAMYRAAAGSVWFCDGGFAAQ